MGAWTFVDRRLEAAMVQAGFKKHTRPVYAGRAASAATATGSPAQHEEQRQILLEQALGDA
jgi:2-oxoglutarate dehydrogenase E1 component